MDVNGKPRMSFAYPLLDFQYPLKRRLGGTDGLPGRVGERKILFPVYELELSFVKPVI
jgi:hypothetical protein